jgi:hypothetical protein
MGFVDLLQSFLTELDPFLAGSVINHNISIWNEHGMVVAGKFHHARSKNPSL